MTMRTIRRHSAAAPPPGTKLSARVGWALLPVLALLAGVAAPATLAGAAGGAAATARRPIAATELFRFGWGAEPRTSPDGTRIAFVRVTVDAKHDGYETALWIVDADAAGAVAGPRPLTAGRAAPAPRRSP